METAAPIEPPRLAPFDFTAEERAMLSEAPPRLRMIEHLAEWIRPAALAEWAREENESFGGRSPLALIADDDFEPLEQMLYEFREGAYL